MNIFFFFVDDEDLSHFLAMVLRTLSVGFVPMRGACIEQSVGGSI